MNEPLAWLFWIGSMLMCFVLSARTSRLKDHLKRLDDKLAEHLGKDDNYVYVGGRRIDRSVECEQCETKFDIKSLGRCANCGWDHVTAGCSDYKPNGRA